MGVLKILLFLALAYACVVGAMYLAQRKLLFPGAGWNAPPGLPGWGEAVSIATPDGETLGARISPAPAGRPTVLLFHGNADHIANFGFLARAFEGRRIGLLAVSYRGYGDSTGAPSEAGLLVDGVASYDWLAQRSNGAIVLLGQSLGSGVAIHVAAQRPSAALVLVSPYLSVKALAQEFYPFLPVAWLIRDPFRSDLIIDSISVPKLFIHGGGDTIVPLASGQALFALAREPKRMVVYEHLAHNDIWTDEVVAEILDFIEKDGG